MLAKLTKVSTAVAMGATMLAGAISAPAMAADKATLTLVSEMKPSWVRNFNPFLATSRLATTNQFIYEPLLVVNEIKGGEVVYRLANKHYFSDDLKTVYFELKKDVKWSDGEAFTADDVVYSLGVAAKGGAADVAGISSKIAGVKKVDDYKVAVELKDVNTGIVAEIVRAPIVAEHVFSKVADLTTFTNENPVGTGPFTQVDTFTPQVYVQCRNPNYYENDKLAVDCIRMPQLANNDQLLAAAIKGDLDWTSAFIPDIDRVLVSQNKHYHYWFPAAGSASFMVNFKTPNANNAKAFNDVQFRRAFSMALDRQAIVDIAGYGYWSVNEYPDALGDQFAAWANKDSIAKYGKYSKFNIEGAKKLLKDAGYKDVDGDGFVENPDGTKIEFKILAPNGWSDFINTVQIGVEGLQEVGINASVSTPEFAILTEKVQNADYDAQFTNYFAGPDPFKYYNTAFHSEQMDKARFGGHHNVDKELDALIDSFNKTGDQDEKVAIVHKIQERIGANQTTMAAMSTNYNYQYNTKRFTGWFNDKNPQARPVVWPDTPERLLHVLNLKPVK